MKRYTEGPLNIGITNGTGSPQGIIFGSPGDLYQRDNGGAGELWQKDSGYGTQTGWVQVSGPGSGAPTIVNFTTTAAKNYYTATDVPALAGAVGKTVRIVTLDDGLITSQTTWDGTDFIINFAVVISGGEKVVAFFSQ